MFANVSGTTSTSAQYPTDGRGAASTTAGNSHVATKGVELLGVLVTTAVAGNVVIADHAGTSGYALTIPITTATVVPVMLDIPPNAGFFTPGIRFTASASGLIFSAFYNPKTGP